MRIIKSLEAFKKIQENENQTPEFDKNTQNKEYFYNGKKIQGEVKNNNLVSDGKTINLKDVNEIGKPIKSIKELKPYFYYIQNIDNTNYRVIKVTSVKGDVVKFSFKSNNEKSEEKEQKFNEINLLKSIPEKQDKEGFEESKKKSQEKEEVTSEKTDDFEEAKKTVDDTKDIKSLPKEKISNILSKGAGIEDKVKFIDDDGKEIEISVADAVKRLKSQMEDKKEKSNESFKNDKKYSRIFEADSLAPDSVKNIWKLFFQEWDNQEKFRMTQREVDEKEQLIKKGTNDLTLDVGKRPDPIVGIVKIYTRAHELYYTDVIPSGRPKGVVSQKTFREYMQLGNPSYKGDPDDPYKGGPYAVKSIFRQWRNGVLKILQDQEYRKILSNVNFIVPGAKDTFNPETKLKESRMIDTSLKYKINEREGDIPLKRGSSPGQILFEFMTEMLNPKKLDDFEGLETELLNKYFGLDRVKVDISKPNPTIKPIPENEIDENNLKWSGYSSFKKFYDDWSSLNGKEVVIISFKEGSEIYLICGRINKITNNQIEFGELGFCEQSSKTTIIKDIENNKKTVDDFDPKISFNKQNVNKTFKDAILKFDNTHSKIKWTINSLSWSEKEFGEYDILDKTVTLGTNKTSVFILKTYDTSTKKYKNYV